MIGETGEGDYYCIDVDGEHTGVLQFRHQEVDFEILTDSIGEFDAALTWLAAYPQLLPGPVAPFMGFTMRFGERWPLMYSASNA